MSAPEPYPATRRVGGLTPGGETLLLEPDAAARERIAAFLRINRVLALRADGRLIPDGRGGARLSLRFEGEVEQACIVTLTPVRQQVAGDITRRFVADEAVLPGIGEDGEIELDPEAADDIEPVGPGGLIDLGAVLMEELALALDPYPRQPGAELAPAADRQEAAAPPSPFAALAQLKAANEDER